MGLLKLAGKEFAVVVAEAFWMSRQNFHAFFQKFDKRSKLLN